MQAWDTFAAITGGAAAALTGLLFVAVSLHIDFIASSQELRNRAALVLSLFAIVLFISILIVIPGQARWVLGAELIVLAVITILEEVALLSGPPNTVTSLLLLVAGIFLVIDTFIGTHVGLYVLVVPVMAGLGFGGVQAWMLLISFRENVN